MSVSFLSKSNNSMLLGSVLGRSLVFLEYNEMCTSAGIEVAVAARVAVWSQQGGCGETVAQSGC